MSETIAPVNLESLAVVSQRLREMEQSLRTQDAVGALGIGAAALLVEMAGAEITRLKSVIQSLMEAIEPFAEALQKSAYRKDIENDVLVHLSYLVPVTINDFRRALDAKTKAEEMLKGEWMVQADSVPASSNEKFRPTAEWLPIETVPRDGTLVELFFPYPTDSIVERIAYLRWHDGDWWDENDWKIEEKYNYGIGPSHWRPFCLPQTDEIKYGT